jgi:hypothetical protein
MENFIGKFKDCGSVIKKIKMFKGTFVEKGFNLIMSSTPPLLFKEINPFLYLFSQLDTFFYYDRYFQFLELK